MPNGNLFYSGKVKDETWERFPSWKVFKGGVILEVDWNGKILWEHHDRDHHHDARRTPSGGAIYLTVEPVPEEMAAKVRGGVPGSEAGGMWADVIVEVDASGNRVWEWSASKHLDFQRDLVTFNVIGEEYNHLGESDSVSPHHLPPPPE